MKPWPSIPGETPIDDVSGLKIKSIRTRQQLHEAEAENIRIATFKYFSRKPTKTQAPFTMKWLKSLHKEMFGSVWKWAGTFRTRELNLGVPASHIEAQLHQLLGDLDYWKTHNMPVIEQAAMLHHRSVTIHPFLNGNGRWSRHLANIWLVRHNSPFTAWAEDHLGGESTIRQTYLAAVRAADQGEYEPLFALHRTYT